ncbi:hypothetical protein E3A20_06700 [Planctomyces bekefii]|uniref:Uncharacterized protein n=1 Tax=Planctomyces bekefii TaxID=1653850 RepID=A0A5C6M6J8_9PLAN|nr:hypothetical protein E3A20_06700 [Planctomyces bekefii]
MDVQALPAQLIFNNPYARMNPARASITLIGDATRDGFRGKGFGTSEQKNFI